jgi:L-alanine-DL-glutamate epimerase-like enolase superfamily enzyme
MTTAEALDRGGPRLDVPVTSVEAAAYTIPTDRPEADGTFEWDSTTWVLVRVGTDDPGLPSGLGWTYAPAAAVRVVDDLLAPAVVGHGSLEVGAAWEAMVRAVRNAGRPGLVGMAISAVDTALWDLAARVLDVPLDRLFGAVREDVPVYGSGGFTTDPESHLREQMRGWVEQGIPRVKLKIGESWGGNVRRDLERVALSRQVIGSDVELYVDANGGYDAAQAVRLGRQLEDLGVTWFEEPVSSDDHAGLRRVREHVAPDVTAGEYGGSLAYFAHLLAAETVDCVQIDVTRCGGYTEWFRIASLAAAHGLEVSGHCAPALHAPVARATPNFRHLEWFEDHVRIEGHYLEGFPSPDDGTLRPSGAPGHGLSVRETDLASLRVA